MIFINYHAANNRSINIVKVHCKSINNFWRSWLWSFLFLSWSRSFFTFFLLTTRSRSSWFFLTFMIFFILWITSYTTTNFTASRRKFCFSNTLWYLTNTWFIWFRKGFHTIFTTSVSGLKNLSLFFLLNLLFFIFWMILWILSSMNKIFFWTSITSTCLTSLTT